MKGKLFFILYILVSISAVDIIEAQDEIPDIMEIENEKANDAFRSSQLVNVQTTAMPSPHGFEFHIRHRFGNVSADETLITQFLGTDGTANIHFSFIFPLTEKLYIGCGRTKTGKTYDIELKTLLLSQTKNNSMPFSMVFYFNTAINSDQYTIPKNAYFSDGVTPFEYKFNHRLAYNTQLVTSHNFSDKVSVQATFVFIYKNLANPGFENETFAIPVSGMIRTGVFSSIIFEYSYIFNNPSIEKNLYPLSVAYEMGTAGHLFQIVLSSTKDLLEQSMYTGTSYDYSSGKFVIGFNIKRTFWYKKKSKN